MNFTSGGPNRVPSENPLSSKLQSLASLKRIIRQLEDSLTAYRTKFEKLEKEIYDIRAVAPLVDGLPVEVLIHIVEDTLELCFETNNSLTSTYRERRNLMLVNKHWHNVIAEAHLLWSTIEIIAPHWTDDAFEWAKRQDDFLDQALVRSGEAPLDVTVNLSNMTDGQTYVYRRVKNCLGGDGDDVDDWMEDVSWEDCPTTVAYNGVFEGLMYKLTGSEGRHSLRWRSLCFTFPWGDTSCSLLPTLIRWPAPRLQSFDVEGGSDPVSGSQELTDSLPSIISIKHLEISRFDLKPMVILSSSLKSLKLWTNCETYDWTELHLLDQFSVLREFCIEVHTGDSCPILTIPPIRMSSLDHLSLIGLVPSQVVQAFDIKRLPKITIQENGGSFQMIPEARIFSAAEYVVYDDLFDHSDESTLLSQLLSQLSAVHTIEVSPKLLRDSMKVVVSSKKEGGLPLLRKIITNLQGNIRMIYKVPSERYADVESILSSCLRIAA